MLTASSLLDFCGPFDHVSEMIYDHTSWPLMGMNHASADVHWPIPPTEGYRYVVERDCVRMSTIAGGDPIDFDVAGIVTKVSIIQGENPSDPPKVEVEMTLENAHEFARDENTVRMVIEILKKRGWK